MNLIYNPQTCFVHLNHSSSAKTRTKASNRHVKPRFHSVVIFFPNAPANPRSQRTDSAKLRISKPVSLHMGLLPFDVGFQPVVPPEKLPHDCIRVLYPCEPEDVFDPPRRGVVDDCEVDG